MTTSTWAKVPGTLIAKADSNYRLLKVRYVSLNTCTKKVCACSGLKCLYSQQDYLYVISKIGTCKRYHSHILTFFMPERNLLIISSTCNYQIWKKKCTYEKEVSWVRTKQEQDNRSCHQWIQKVQSLVTWFSALMFSRRTTCFIGTRFFYVLRFHLMLYCSAGYFMLLMIDIGLLS